MHTRIALLLATLLAAAPLSARAACTPTRSVSEGNGQELKILVPFALPIGLPVAPFAPYFYSAAQFQRVGQVFNLPPGATGSASAPPAAHSARSLPAAAGIPHSSLDSSPAHLLTSSPAQSGIAAHCSSCHAGPAPKAGLSLDHLDALSLTDRLRAIRAVASGQMPKGLALTDDDVRAVIQELTQDPQPQ
jgi:cytochrome c553